MNGIRLTWYGVLVVAFLAGFAATLGVAVANLILAHI